MKEDLTKAQQDDVKEAFMLLTQLSDSNGQTIEVKELRVALKALGFDPAKEEIKRMIADLNNPAAKQGDGGEKGSVPIDYNDFMTIM